MTKKLMYLAGTTLMLAATGRAETYLAVQTSELAWVQVDGGLRRIASSPTALKIVVTPGSHKVAAEAMVGGSRQEMDVQAEADATTYVQIKLATPIQAPIVPLAPITPQPSSSSV